MLKSLQGDTSFARMTLLTKFKLIVSRMEAKRLEHKELVGGIDGRVN